MIVNDLTRIASDATDDLKVATEIAQKAQRAASAAGVELVRDIRERRLVDVRDKYQHELNAVREKLSSKERMAQQAERQWTPSLARLREFASADTARVSNLLAVARSLGETGLTELATLAVADRDQVLAVVLTSVAAGLGSGAQKKVAEALQAMPEPGQCSSVRGRAQQIRSVIEKVEAIDIARITGTVAAEANELEEEEVPA